MRHAIALVLCMLAAGRALGGGLNAYTAPMCAFAETSAPAAPQYTQRFDTAWTPAAPASGLFSTQTWSVLRNCPQRDELTMVTCNDTKGIELQVWTSGVWSAVSTLTTDCGTYDQRVYDAEYEQASSKLLAVYRKGTSASLYYRLYTAANPPEQTYTPGLAAAPVWIKLIAHPGTDEMILLAATTTALYAAVWNGAAFGNFNTLSTTLPALTSPYDAAYLLTNRNALVVWGDAATSKPSYTLWNGSTWASTHQAPALPGIPTIMKVAACPKTGANDAMMVCIDQTKAITGCPFDGANWGAVTTLDSNAATAYQRRVDVAYERAGNKALVLWHSNGQNALRYRTWSGTAWSGTLIGPDMGAESLIVREATGMDSDEVLGAVQVRGVSALGDYQVYSQTGVDSLGNAAVAGLVGQQVSGVTLPAPPAATPSAVDKIYGANTTVTIPPGTYRDLSMGNSFTGNLSAGTYIFRNVVSGNGTTFNCDTSAGDVNIIFTGTVAAWNGLMVNRNGSGQVIFQLITGSFSANNNSSNFSASIIAYAGSINFGNNVQDHGKLYAYGNITVGSGTITESTYPFPPSPGSLKLLRWSGGSLVTSSTASSSIAGYATRQGWALSAPPFGAPLLYISRWREIGQDE
jgi:hypothetical protein